MDDNPKNAVFTTETWWHGKIRSRFTIRCNRIVAKSLHLKIETLNKLRSYNKISWPTTLNYVKALKSRYSKNTLLIYIIDYQ
jgi:hypothetical protein